MVTEVVGETVPFDEQKPVQGYIPGEAFPLQEGDERYATPLKIFSNEDLEKLRDVLVLDWGKGLRLGHQWAGKCVGEREKPILVRSNLADSEKSEMSGAELTYENRAPKHHIKFERRSRIAGIVKMSRPLTCEACGLDAERRFGRKIAHSCIEAHHLLPFSQIPEEGRYISEAQIALLCATCHRIAHASDNPEDIETLREIVNGDSR